MARRSNSSSKKANGPRPQLPNSTKPPKKRVNRIHAGITAAAVALYAAAAAAGFTAQAATEKTATLPLDSSLYFVLDDTISSRDKAGTVVHAHLRDPIVLDGVTVAPAGTQASIDITTTSGAQMGNVDGYADIFFEPLRLSDGSSLPLTTPTSHLDPQTSAGRESTREVTDTVGDIIIPYHVLYHVLRKGTDVVLKPGTIIRARTAATLSLARGAVAVSTPPPLVAPADTPHPAFMPEPLSTPPGYIPPTPKATPSASVQPTPAPTPTP